MVPKRQVQSACRARRISRDSGCCEGATVNKGAVTGALDAAEGKSAASRGGAVEETLRCVLALTRADSTGNQGAESGKKVIAALSHALRDTGTARPVSQEGHAETMG